MVKKILIVDDSFFIRTVLEAALKQAGVKPWGVNPFLPPRLLEAASKVVMP